MRISGNNVGLRAIDLAWYGEPEKKVEPLDYKGYYIKLAAVI